MVALIMALDRATTHLNSGPLEVYSI
jgi:hypothetical protein